MVSPAATHGEKQQPTPNENNQMANMTSSPDMKSQQQRPFPNLPLRHIMRSMNRNRGRRGVRWFPGATSYQKSPLSRTSSDGASPVPQGCPRTETPPPEEESSDAVAPKKIGKFFIRLRPKSSTKPADDVAEAADAGKQDSNAAAAEEPGLEPEPEPEPKPEPEMELRNLTPRQPVNKKPKVHAGALAIGGPAAPPGTNAWGTIHPELSLPLNANDAKLAAAEKKVNEEEKEKEKEKGKEKGKEKEKVTKPKVLVTLTQQEIEEDIFSLTGSRPSRKPMKRARDVQKALDRLLPGMSLCDVTPDSYKVQEPRIKG